MLIRCQIEEITLQGDYQNWEGDYVSIDSVQATCSRCGHETESYGTSDSSVKRCLVLMREECPRGEKHFYAAAIETDHWQPNKAR